MTHAEAGAVRQAHAANEAHDHITEIDRLRAQPSQHPALALDPIAQLIANRGGRS